MSLDKSKRAVLDKVFKAENPASVNFWKPSSDAADEVEWNAKIEREIADAKQSDKFKNERTRKQRIKFLEGARMPVSERYVSDLSDNKRALLEQVFGLNAGKQQETAQQAAPVPVWETEAPTSSMLSTKISDTPLETGQGPTPEQRMPMERFDMRAALNPVAVRSGVLLDPGTDGAPKAGDMVLPSGTVLRESDGDLDAFFREQVLPGIEPMQAAADERTRKELTAEGKARDRRWLEHFNIDPVGDYMADAVQAAATSRRERGPARIVEEVLSGVDPEKANAYIASRLADDPEFAAAANRLQGAVPDAEEMSEKEVEQLQAALSPAQRKQYEKAVAEEQKRIAREQGTFQKAADAAWKRQAQLFQEGITHRLVEEMARRNMPKSELSAFARIALNASIPGMLTEWAVSNTAGGDKTLHAQIMQRALEKYDPSIWTRMGGDVAGLLLGTPVFSAGGVLGKAGASVLRRAAERNVMKRLMARGITEGAEGVARRLVSGSMAQRLAQGAVASSATLGTYDAVAAPLAMAAAGENPNVWDVLGAMGRGVATGALLPGIGMATGKVAEAAGSRLGRYAAELGGFAAENAAFVGMGTLYDGIRTGEWGSPEQLAEDFAHSVGVLGTMKSVGALKRGRARNPGFYDKVIAETEFTPEEVEALGRAGVDGRSYKRAVFDLLNAKQSASGREIAERAAEQLGSRYTDVMRSPEVPVSAKAKLMYFLEGRVPARLPLTTNVRRTVGENGRTTVDLLDPAGNLVQRRTFSTEKAAEAFERESAGVREINAIQYYEALIDRVQTLDAATDAYAAECGVPVEAVKGEVRKAAEGQSHDRELVRRVMELSGQTGAGTLDVPGMLAAEISRKHGLREGGFEQALSRREEVRTPEESAAVAEYAARLKEIATQELRPEPTPEERVERQLVEEAEQAIVQAQNRDDGVVYTATMQDGRQANIIKGANLVYDPETGEVNAAQSDPTVVVRYEDGTMRQVSVREIDMIVEAVSAGDARSEALRAIREQLDAAAREEALAAAVEAGGLVELKDGRIGAVEGVNEDGSYRVALQDGEGRILTEQVVAGDIAGPVAKEPAQEVEQPAGTAADPLLGRSLTAEEAGQVISEMEAAAVPVPELELTPENWVAQFGEQGKVQTPIGEVKMGENQLAKLFLKGRDRYFGMIKPTLTEPDMVLEKSAPDEKAERQSKYLFVKTFLKQDGSRFVYFESVTVSKNGMEVAISNHEADGQAIKKEMQNGKILHLSTKLSSGSDRYLTETPSREGPDLVPSSDNSLHKDTTTIPEKQAAEQDIPRLKNGQPDFNAMPTEMLAVELSAAVGHDKAVERLQVARGVNSKNMDKLHRTLDGMGDLNKAMAVEQRLETMRQEDARLAGALEQLGAVGEPVAGKASAENFSQEIERLFPEGLPNVRAQVLADIARGQRFVWNDSPDGTKSGVASALGFTGNESERRARFGLLGSEATGAKHVSRYVHDLWQDSNGYAFDMDDTALRDEVIDVLLTTPSRASAMEQLRDMAARTAEDAPAPRDAEEQAAAEAYDRARNDGRMEPIVAEQPGPDDVPFSVVSEAASAPAGVTPERWTVIVDQLRRVVGAEHVVTDPAAVRAAYDRIMQRGTEMRRQQVTVANERFNAQLDLFEDGTLPSDEKLVIGHPCPVLLACGVNNSELYITQSVLRDYMAKHGLSLGDLKNLPEALDYPIMVYEWGSKAKSIVVITAIPRGNERIAVAVRLKTIKDGIKINKIASIHGKSAERLLKDMNTPLTDFGAENLKWVDKEKVLDWMSMEAPLASSASDQGHVTATNIVTNFENPKIEPENTASQDVEMRYFRTPEGEVYGFTAGGTIYLDSERMNAASPIHEYTELWSQIVARENPELWMRGAELLKQTLIWDDVNADPNYKNLSEELRASETLARIVADEFAGKQAAITDSSALLGKLRAWMRKFWGFMKSTFAKWTKRELKNLTTKKFAQMPLRDFVEGIDLQKVRGPEPELQRQYAEAGEQVTNSDTRLSMNGEKARIREQALADGSYLKAPNGKSSRLTADQWETVRTRQFKKWFGDWENDPENASKMVDENGEPKVFYHNTNASFHAFDKNKTGTSNDVGWLGDGFYFYGDITEGRGYGHLRMDVFLNVREPYYATSEDNARLAEANSRDMSVAFREDLMSDGYDGVYYNGDLRQEAVVFNPKQIKSATENIGAFDPTNPDIRFNREFTRRRVTTLEKLENKRAALIAERENIANFDEQLAAVEAQIEAYMQSDPVAETFGKDGSGAESQAHLQAVEDAVYDIVRKEGVEGVQVDVVGTAEALLEYARSNNWAKEDIEGIEQGILSRGYYSDDNVTILASLIKYRKIAAGVFWHERTHGITDELRTSDQLTQAAEQAGAELLDAALTKRGYSTELYSMERMADEYVSRGVEILSKKGLLDDYLVTPEADIEPIEAYLAGRNVPELLREYIVESCQHIKNQKYGTQEGILLRAGDTGRAATNTGDQALRDRYNRTAVGTDAGVDGGGNVALRRGFSGSERLSAADDNEGGVRTADAVGVHPTRRGDLEQDSAPKLTKQQQLIADLRRAVRESKAAARSVAQIVSLRVRKEVGTELVEIMGKREFDALVRQIEQATARQEVEKPLQRIAEIVTDLEIKRLQKVVDKFLQLKVQGKGPRGVSVAKEVDDRTRRMFEIFRNNLDRPAKEVAAELREREDVDMLYDLDASAPSKRIRRPCAMAGRSTI